MYIALTTGNIFAQAVALTYVIGRLQGGEKRNGLFSVSNSLYQTLTFGYSVQRNLQNKPGPLQAYTFPFQGYRKRHSWDGFARVGLSTKSLSVTWLCYTINS